MNYKKAIFIFITAITIFRLIYINLFPIIPDEAYYWQWARHLDFGYYEQGPILAIVIFIFTLFTKINTLFTIRLGAVVLSLLTMILSVLTYKKLFPGKNNDKGSFFNLLFMNSAIIYSAGAVLMMHDTVMIFFFALFIYEMLIIFDKPDNYMRWAFAGIILGFGVMSKYTLLIIYPSLIIFLILSKFDRKYIRGPLILSVFFLLSLFPVIYWNITHNFASINFILTLNQAGPKINFNFKYFFEFLGGQLVVVSVFLVPFFILSLVKNIKNRGFNPHYMISCFFIIPMICFMIMSLKSRIEANWPAFLFYPLFFIATNYLLSDIKYSRIKHIIYTAGFISLIVIYIQIVMPFIPFSEKADISKKFYGYKQLAEKLQPIYDKYKDKGVVFFTARHYQVASALAFYLPGQPNVYIVVPHEANKNYRFWNTYRNTPCFNAIYVYREGWEHDDMKSFFKSSDIIDKIDITRNNKTMNTYYVDFDTCYLGPKVAK